MIYRPYLLFHKYVTAIQCKRGVYCNLDLDRQRGYWQSEKSTIVVLLRVKLKLERRLLTLADQWIELVLLLL